MKVIYEGKPNILDGIHKAKIKAQEDGRTIQEIALTEYEWKLLGEEYERLWGCGVHGWDKFVVCFIGGTKIVRESRR